MYGIFSSSQTRPGLALAGRSTSTRSQRQAPGHRGGQFSPHRSRGRRPRACGGNLKVRLSSRQPRTASTQSAERPGAARRRLGLIKTVFATCQRSRPACVTSFPLVIVILTGFMPACSKMSPRETCSRAWMRSTCSHRREHSSEARSPWRKDSRIMVASRCPKGRE